MKPNFTNAFFQKTRCLRTVLRRAVVCMLLLGTTVVHAQERKITVDTRQEVSLVQFFRQVEHSGEARIVLSQKYPSTLKLVHCLPAVFVVGVIGLCLLGIFFPWLYSLLLLYVLLLFVDATCAYRGNIGIGILAVAASFTQLFGYGTGFIRAWWRWKMKKK